MCRCSKEELLVTKGQLSKKCQRESVIIFLSISLNMCFGYSKETSHGDGSFEYPQHMFWLRNKNIILGYALLSGGPVMLHGLFSTNWCK